MLARYMRLLVGAALLYTAWTALTRWNADRAFARRVENRRVRPAPRMPADTGVRITHFYASTGEIVRGKHAIICYGVENASAVRLEPPAEQLSPSMNRCFAAQPEEDTTYKLLASGADGREVSASFRIHVNPAPPNILFITVTKLELRRDEVLGLCYGVENAASVRLDPQRWQLPPKRKHCLAFRPLVTTQFTLTATSAEGLTDRERFTIKVL